MMLLRISTTCFSVYGLFTILGREECMNTQDHIASHAVHKKSRKDTSNLPSW